MKILIAGHLNERAACLLDVDFVLGKVWREYECVFTLGDECCKDDGQRRGCAVGHVYIVRGILKSEALGQVLRDGSPDTFESRRRSVGVQLDG